MFCNKCGEKVKKTLKYCTNCGNKLIKEEKDGSILFERKKQFYGVLIPIKVYLDGELVATLSADKSVVVPVTTGNHRLSFNLWSGNGQYDINVTEENPNIKVVFKLSMGLITSKPKIISIENI
jgi:hypothetical protein